MDLNLKRFLAYYGKIILMPEILMSVYSCNVHDAAVVYTHLFTCCLQHVYTTRLIISIYLHVAAVIYTH